ncbi:hypothetical protein [Salinilacihabitans rarus]|uniref:hypothetical protein n=1 Tax=Salinilacihabitans rarus TaxID=2961596 RepID=UPI0020C8366D|nr:hypothetical protein [Salinilacihabitans rarus]
MSLRTASLVAAAVAVVAAPVHVGSQYAGVVGIQFLDLGAETVTTFALAATLGLLLVEPVAVFAVGYRLARAVDAPRAYAVVAAAFFLGAAAGAVAGQFAFGRLLEIQSASVGQSALAYLERAVATGLRIAVAGLAGVGAGHVFRIDRPAAGRTTVTED